MLPKFGRRAGNEGEAESNAQPHGKTTKSSSGAEKKPGDRPADRVVQADKLRSVDDDVDRNMSEQATKRAVEEKERIVRSVADAPVGYTVSMPKLTELDISNLWNEFLQSIHQEVDMSALTSCLVQKLDDEDVPWNPDMLLVQLTSDMLDAADALDTSPVAGKKAADSRRRNLALMEEPEPFESAERQGEQGAAGPAAPQAAGDSKGTAKAAAGAGARPSSPGESPSRDGKREKRASAQNLKPKASKGEKSPTMSDTKAESQTKERQQTSSSSTKSKSGAHAPPVKESSGSTKKK